MKHSRTINRIASWTLVLLFSQVVVSAICGADQANASRLHFQKPGRTAQSRRLKSSPRDSHQQFRAPRVKQRASQTATASTPSFLRIAEVERAERASRESSVSKAAPRQTQTSPNAQQSERRVAKRAIKPLRTTRRQQPTRRDQQVVPATEELIAPPPADDIQLGGDHCDVCGGDGICEAGCGLAEPGCGIVEPGCSFEEAVCGLPGSGPVIGEPGCGLVDPSCGAADQCGSCVGRPGPDYWCFPVCLPRFKDLSVWTGVHGFRGPRDFSSGRSDSNFGFQEGVNISGRTPLVGLLFPQISYQLGFQAVQSRLSGTVSSPDDRNQEFVTAGFFRRVHTGMQFGVVWDYMRDDLDINANFQQIRSEISIKSPLGREIGFWSAVHVNDTEIGGITYETVDQFALFYRWNFGQGTEGRIWVGGTDDSEGILGAEFNTPLNDRWSLQSGFNYLITDQSDGLQGVSEESWNIGINLVWHLGSTARRGFRSPFRPLFTVADNGWMFVDRK